MSYAGTTSVSPERSQAEIQQTLRKYGASRFGVMEDENGAHVLFAFANLNIQMSVPLPNRTDDEFTKTPTGKPRSIDQQRYTYDQKVKAQWRALMLAIKSKLVSIRNRCQHGRERVHGVGGDAGRENPCRLRAAAPGRFEGGQGAKGAISGTETVMTRTEHIERHKALHKSLDELLADYIGHTGRMPSSATLMEFLTWSYSQTIDPAEPMPSNEPQPPHV